jgi:hypothetical protein
MRYALYGFSQPVAVEFNLDHTDLLLLRWFIDFRDTNDMVHETINGKIYYWIKYKKIFEDLPILNIKSTDALRRRFKKLVDKKILIHYTKKNMGTFSFYGIGSNYVKLISTKGGTILKSEGTTQKSERYDSKVGGGTTQKSEQNINLLKDSSIKDNKDIVDSKPESTERKNNSKEIELNFEKVWKLYPLKRGKGKVKDKTKKELYKMGFEAINLAIERYIKDVDLRRSDFKDLNYMNGSTFFNSGYHDYLGDDFVFYKTNAEDWINEPKKTKITTVDIETGEFIVKEI